MRISQKAAIPPALEKPLHELGQALARLRVARGLPQRLAAERAGVSRNTLSRIENGDPSVAFGQILRYVAVLGKVDALTRAFSAEADAPARGLASREKSRRARELTQKELKRYDF